ncbi:ATP-grasp fold amidoligase family protein [Enterobacter sichuanensis]|uniref:ATP-grasp fold amidoligase family protein n=1 Tax=Enterobacter sichuanensis TaxID=2071710 RepID=UPI002B1F81D1|nr:ATP-grasp fold amidoligase family protein [Enterobacter sichuanensis]MEA5168335.1 ATP-grasp fold amidoligase family protein [Enterobacter sichuanensis]
MSEIKEKLRLLKAYILPEPLYLKMIFKKHLGYSLNLREPKTLNEKLQWLKLYYRKPLLTTCADKIAVRDYIKKIIGEQYLIPLVHSTENPEELLHFEFPNYPFIIKANHDSGGYHIVRNKEEMKIKKIVSDAKKWLKSNHYSKSKEWQYKNIKPQIVVEKLLLDKDGRIPNDIKFTCINGRVEIVHVDSNKEIKHLRNNYTRDFNPLLINWPEEYCRNDILSMPESFLIARDLAELLAKPFPFVRVDFYLMGPKIFFGELTFHPTSGFGRFSPSYYDYKYGSKLKLPMFISSVETENESY